MKQPSLLLRASTQALAALFVLAQLVDGSGAHRCPMHDAVAGLVVGESPHSATSHHGGPAGDHAQHSACTCLGACQAATVALAAADGSVAPVARPASTISPGVPADPHPESPSHRLPFALGPPVIA